jgi:glycine/D-amino acid oxidase-like deaminating enzyme
MDNQRSVRIGIVGAGAAGLSLARLLRERGFAQVTVLERSDRVGGMSLTLNVGGHAHELGTCYTLAGYGTTTRWMREAGVRRYRLTKHEYRLRDGRLIPFRDYVRGEASLLGGVSKMIQYMRHWLPFHRWDLRGNPDEALDARGCSFREMVAKSFGHWLVERGLDPIARISLRAVTVAGYGALDELPALYGLRWVTPALLWSGLTSQMSEPVPGWQSLWTHLTKALDVRLCCEISGCEPTTGGWALATSQGEFVFDHLFIAAPVDGERGAWLSLNPDRRSALGLDGALSWREYTASLVEVENWFRDGQTRAFESAALDSEARRRCRLLVGRRAIDKATGAGPLPGNLYLVYQYSDPGMSEETLTQILHDDLASDKATLRAVLERRRWRYSPQFSEASIRCGAVSRFERFQGKDNLWFTGAIASHESVDNIVTYNERLVNRLEAALAGGDPSSAAVFEQVARRHRAQGTIGPLKMLA